MVIFCPLTLNTVSLHSKFQALPTSVKMDIRIEKNTGLDLENWLLTRNKCTAEKLSKNTVETNPMVF